MGLSTPDHEKRKQLVDKLNGALADLDLRQKELNDAKSTFHSAERRYEDARLEYSRLRRELEKLLPEMVEEPVFHAVG